MPHQGRIQAQVSLDGMKDLYLIIIGLGITTALTPGIKFKTILEFGVYLILLSGYLLTVFRFSIGFINMLTHVAQRVHNQWTRVVSIVALSVLGCGLCFFWMGLSLRNLPLFIFNTILLLGCHWFMLFVCHRPWAFPRGWGAWMLKKTLSICLGYPGGVYDPKRDTQNYLPLTLEEVTVKSTHYQWIRSNFWLACLFAGSFAGWSSARPPAAESLRFWHLSLEAWLGLVLILFAIWDFYVNKAYYFGEDDEALIQPDL